MCNDKKNCDDEAKQGSDNETQKLNVCYVNDKLYIMNLKKVAKIFNMQSWLLFLWPLVFVQWEFLD